MTLVLETLVWVDVCAVDELIPDRGVCALVDGEQVAVFRVSPLDELFAVSNHDPFSRANVISRGIVGSRGDAAKVASPMYKQSFDLRTGQCLDDPAVALRVFAVRERLGRVEVAAGDPAP
ncbi:MAG TPA: nitrite reductase small subunit NirD [Acidimicrobiales bacterium]|nr:nitrite reductase small subunit NirD [Acidimicrobiales bacterium]